MATGKDFIRLKPFGEKLCEFAEVHVSQLWQEISEENRHVQDIMSTLENFQLGEVPAKPSNHDDCEVRPNHVDLRYHKGLELLSWMESSFFRPLRFCFEGYFSCLFFYIRHIGVVKGNTAEVFVRCHQVLVWRLYQQAVTGAVLACQHHLSLFWGCRSRCLSVEKPHCPSSGSYMLSPLPSDKGGSHPLKHIQYGAFEDT